MINLHEVWDQAGIELANPVSAVRHASVVRHVNDCAMRPGASVLVSDRLVVSGYRLFIHMTNLGVCLYRGCDVRKPECCMRTTKG